MLCDESFRLGSSLLSSREVIGNKSAADFATDVVAELDSLDNVTLMPRTTVFGWYDDMVFGASNGYRNMSRHHRLTSRSRGCGASPPSGPSSQVARRNAHWSSGATIGPAS